MMQCRVEALRDRAREAMERVGLTEGDLCTAWHHLQPARRERVHGALEALPEALLADGWEAPL
jgi:hypothetical protein